MYEASGIYFVTVRAQQSRLLLLASALVNQVIGGVLARAVNRYGIELFGYVVASNHLHLLCRARDGRLSVFMQFFLANVAKKLGVLVDWREGFFGRRFSAEPVLDDEAVVDRLRYILAHGVKEGLVRKVLDWPGLHCAGQLLRGMALTFNWYNWTARWKAAHPKGQRPGPFSPEIVEEELLTLSRLPAWEALSPSEISDRVSQMIADIEKETAATRRTALGVAKMREQQPHDKPVRTKRSKRALCHASCVELRQAYRDKYRIFWAAFVAASERFRGGDWTAVFPPFAFRPRCLPLKAV